MQILSFENRSSIEEDIKKEFSQFVQMYLRTDFYCYKNRQEAQKIYRQYDWKVDENNKFNLKDNVLVIQIEDLIHFNVNLAFAITEEYYRYENILNKVFTNFMKTILREEEEKQSDNRGKNYRYYVVFQEPPNSAAGNFDACGIRELRSNKLGKLQTVIGTITRSFQVNPELIVGVFKCLSCNQLSPPIEQQFKYTQPKKCLNVNCDSKWWQLDLQSSQFADMQMIRVQQDPSSIPPGCMPRSINIVLRNHNAEKAQPGDKCRFMGYLCVAPSIISMLKPGERTTISTRNPETRGNGTETQGVKGLKGVRQLSYKYIFVATSLTIHNKQYHQTQNTLLDDDDDEEQQIENQNQQKKPYNQQIIYEKLFSKKLDVQLNQLKKMRENPRLLEILAQSIFKRIYGHNEIKKALLLQLFGGVHKKIIQNKITLRGDINILLVGDPSTAKSQFLQTIHHFVPRSVYTNGKTASAAGLTASIVRDQFGNVSIEAGALMLADNGVCCIDEFDKMSLTDVTAIHEAMQQQTISIAKAGVHATLNARTSVLAAANPIFGRYDKSKNLQQNLNISAPIMSRFDMCFVMCDEANIENDSYLCNFILEMHQEKKKVIDMQQKYYGAKSIKNYIGVAKKLKPILTKQAAQKLRQCYTCIRTVSKQSGAVNIATVRQLESIIRLSEAIAKLHLNLSVTAQYVQQAYELILSSITRLRKAAIQVPVEEEEKMKENEWGAQNVLQDQVMKKNKQKKQKVVSLSEQAYKQMQKNIISVFRQYNKMQSQGDEQEIKLSQGNISNYLIALEVDKGSLQNEEQMNNYRKIVRGVIKKMIRDERMLMIAEDSSNDNERILKIHPNLDINII